MYIGTTLTTHELLQHYAGMSSPEGVIRQPVSFESDRETLVGEIVLPDGPVPHPSVLFVAGTGSQNREGDFYRDGRWHVYGLYRLKEDAFHIYRELIETGNPDVTIVTLPGADHSMHVAPTGISEVTSILERLNHSSMRHPVSEFF